MNRVLAALGMAFAFAGGVAVGSRITPARVPVQEGPAPEVRKSDGTLVLARQGGQERRKEADAATGGESIRLERLEALPAIPGHPVTLELIAFRAPEGIRVQAKAEGGVILKGEDLVIRAPPFESARPWSAGPLVTVDPDGRRRYGAALAWTKGRATLAGGASPGGATVFFLWKL